MDIPLEPQKAVYQNFVPANYVVILSVPAYTDVCDQLNQNSNKLCSVPSEQGKRAIREVPGASSLLTFSSDSQKIRLATLDANLTA